MAILPWCEWKMNQQFTIKWDKMISIRSRVLVTCLYYSTYFIRYSIHYSWPATREWRVAHVQLHNTAPARTSQSCADYATEHPVRAPASYTCNVHVIVYYTSYRCTINVPKTPVKSPERCAMWLLRTAALVCLRSNSNSLDDLNGCISNYCWNKRIKHSTIPRSL